MMMKMKFMKRNFLLPILIFTLIASCSPIPAPDSHEPFDGAQGEPNPAALTSTTFLADITRNIAGDRAAIDSLLPIGADPHSYQPTPQDMVKIERSKLIIINGAGYESFLAPLLENNGDKKIIVEASANIEAGKNAEVDPHMWLDPNLVITYVENIRAALTQYDPGGAAVYQSNAEAYTAQLKELDLWIQDQVKQIPANKKLLVTNHEALNYFAKRYGFTVAGSVIPSFSSNAAPSAQQMAALIDEIKKLGVQAIFLDAADNDTLAQQIANETGVTVVADLRLESLTEGAPAATYIDMMKHNVARIVEALK
jgi:ABC-type Zn uptake system ZnuABC Zn-binding protein ZnuA